MYTVTDTEHRQYRCAQYCAAITTLTFIAILQVTAAIPTGVLLPA